MSGPAADLAGRLAERAEAVCRHYLSNGRRYGNWWCVGDVNNTRGRSLFVRLKGSASGRGAAGRWSDAATGQHGDLLDLIALNRGLDRFADLAGEARHFLALPDIPASTDQPDNTLRRSYSLIQRIIAESVPLSGTPAETWLQVRGIDATLPVDSLRYHPACRTREGDRLQSWPAMIAMVSDTKGKVTGLMRTFLAPGGAALAPIPDPRRALGSIGGHAVRFGDPAEVMLAGEGIETVLSLKSALLDMPMAAALSAGNLGRLNLPAKMRRLYVAADRDLSGRNGAAILAERARDLGVEAVMLMPRLNDFNDDLRQMGIDEVRGRLRRQLVAEDAARCLYG